MMPFFREPLLYREPLPLPENGCFSLLFFSRAELALVFSPFFPGNVSLFLSPCCFDCLRRPIFVARLFSGREENQLPFFFPLTPLPFSSGRPSSTGLELPQVFPSFGGLPDGNDRRAFFFFFFLFPPPSFDSLPPILFFLPAGFDQGFPPSPFPSSPSFFFFLLIRGAGFFPPLFFSLSRWAEK